MSSQPTAKPTLYYVLESPPCQTVLATARLAGIDLNLKEIDYGNNEHNQEHFVKINPLRCVPALVDEDGFALNESRAIAAYLLQTRRPDSPLYPHNDIKKRFTVDRFLHYELGTLFPAITDVVYPIFITGKIDSARIPRMDKVLKTFNDYLAGNGTDSYITGDTQLTLADISAYFLWRLFELAPEIDLTPYPAALAWAESVKQALAPANTDGLLDNSMEQMKVYVDAVKSKMINKSN